MGDKDWSFRVTEKTRYYCDAPGCTEKASDQLPDHWSEWRKDGRPFHFCNNHDPLRESQVIEVVDEREELKQWSARRAKESEAKYAADLKRAESRGRAT